MEAMCAAATLDAWLNQAAGRIATALGLTRAEARLEARVLAAHALGVNRAWLAAHGGDTLAPTQATAMERCIARRLRGEPVAYITGRREFYGLEFIVTPDVLIPRPETELLVDLALERLPAERPARVLDLGTGSGAVALAIAAHRPAAHVLAVDRSQAALCVARDNANHLDIGNVTFQQSDWYLQVRAKNFDIIVANPPYLAAGDPHLARGDLRFEPRQALCAGEDALAAIRVIVQGAPTCLRPGGWLLLEHGRDQAEACQALLCEHGWQDAQTWPDLAGLARVSGGRLGQT